MLRPGIVGMRGSIPYGHSTLAMQEYRMSSTAPPPVVAHEGVCLSQEIPFLFDDVKRRTPTAGHDICLVLSGCTFKSSRSVRVGGKWFLK